jgi:hypothetical protein
LPDHVHQRGEVAADLVYGSLVEIEASVDLEDLTGKTSADLLFRSRLSLRRL